MTKVADEDHAYGKPARFDPTFNGPIKNRSCTDVICFILFFACVGGWIAIAVLAYLNGNPENLIYPTDSEGNTCGVGDKAAKPVLFFFDLSVCARVGFTSIDKLNCPTPQVCIERCPNSTEVFYGTSILPGEEDEKRRKMICKYNVNPAESELSINQLIEENKCAPYYIESTDCETENCDDADAVIGRCIPKVFGDLAGFIVDTFEKQAQGKDGHNVTKGEIVNGSEFLAQWYNVQDIAQKLYQDFVSSWLQMLLLLVGSMVLSLIWIIIMRWIAGIIVWVSILALICLLGFGCGYCVITYMGLEAAGANSTNASLAEIGFTTNLQTYLALKDTWLIFSIISGVLFLIIFLLVIALRKRIQIAIAIVKEGSRAVGTMTSTLFFPVVPFLLQLVTVAFYAAVAVYLASIGNTQYHVVNATENCCDGKVNGSTCEPADFNANYNTTGAICIFTGYGGTLFVKYLTYFQVFNIFMWFWAIWFFVGLGQMTLAGAFASYYWAFSKPRDIPTLPLTNSLSRCLRYHLGTLAFGSLLIALIKMIRLALEYLDQKLKGSENAVAKFFLKCLKCCFWCLEKFVKFINKNAYIMCAVYGGNFCSSAKKAFMLLMRNIIRVVVLDKVADFLLFLGKFMVVACIGVLSFFFFSGSLNEYLTLIISDIEHIVPSLNYYFVPVIVIIIGAYLIASVFFAVYGMAVDTLFLCFLEDLERNDGSADRPYYMSKNLMKILGRRNQPRESEKRRK